VIGLDGLQLQEVGSGGQGLEGDYGGGDRRGRRECVKRGYGV